MRRAVGSLPNQTGSLIENTGDTVDLGRLQIVLDGERRQNGWALGQYGLSGGGLLAADVLEIDEKILGLAKKGVAVRLRGNDSVARVNDVNPLST